MSYVSRLMSLGLATFVCTAMPVAGAAGSTQADLTVSTNGSDILVRWSFRPEVPEPTGPVVLCNGGTTLTEAKKITGATAIENTLKPDWAEVSTVLGMRGVGAAECKKDGSTCGATFVCKNKEQRCRAESADKDKAPVPATLFHYVMGAKGNKDLSESLANLYWRVGVVLGRAYEDKGGAKQFPRSYVLRQGNDCKSGTLLSNDVVLKTVQDAQPPKSVSLKALSKDELAPLRETAHGSTFLQILKPADSNYLANRFVRFGYDIVRCQKGTTCVDSDPVCLPSDTACNGGWVVINGRMPVFPAKPAKEPEKLSDELKQKITEGSKGDPAASLTNAKTTMARYRSVVFSIADQWNEKTKKGPEIGIQYSYRVAMRDAYGKRGPWSDSIAARSLDLRPPKAPSHLVGKRVEVSKVNLTWDAVVETGVAYNLYGTNADPRDNANWIALKSKIETNAIQDQSFAFGKKKSSPKDATSLYAWYRVTAVDTSGNESLPSAPAAVRFRGSRNAVSNKLPTITVSGCGNSIPFHGATIRVCKEPKLAWPLIKDDSGNDPAAYRVYRRFPPSSKWHLIGETKATAYNDVYVPGQTTHVAYQVQPLDSQRDPAPPTESESILVPGAKAPLAPVIVSAEMKEAGPKDVVPASDLVVDLSVKAPASQNIEYALMRLPPSGVGNSVVPVALVESAHKTLVGLETLSFHDTNAVADSTIPPLVASGTYDYVVLAQDLASGKSSYSRKFRAAYKPGAEDDAELEIPVGGLPLTVEVHPEAGKSGKNIFLSWKPPSFSASVGEKTGLFPHYVVYRSQFADHDFVQIAPPSLYPLYTDSGVLDGNTYFYQVLVMTSAAEIGWASEVSKGIKVKGTNPGLGCAAIPKVLPSSKTVELAPEGCGPKGTRFGLKLPSGLTFHGEGGDLAKGQLPTLHWPVAGVDVVLSQITINGTALQASVEARLQAHPVMVLGSVSIDITKSTELVVSNPALTYLGGNSEYLAAPPGTKKTAYGSGNDGYLAAPLEANKLKLVTISKDGLNADFFSDPTKTVEFMPTFPFGIRKLNANSSPDHRIKIAARGVKVSFKNSRISGGEISQATVQMNLAGGCPDATKAAAACVPSCTAKTCGDDGCGGICGFCNSNQSCTTGKCAQKTVSSSSECGKCGPSSCGLDKTCSWDGSCKKDQLIQGDGKLFIAPTTGALWGKLKTRSTSAWENGAQTSWITWGAFTLKWNQKKDVLFYLPGGSTSDVPSKYLLSRINDPQEGQPITLTKGKGVSAGFNFDSPNGVGISIALPDEKSAMQDIDLLLLDVALFLRPSGVGGRLKTKGPASGGTVSVYGFNTQFSKVGGLFFRNALVKSGIVAKVYVPSPNDPAAAPTEFAVKGWQMNCKCLGSGPTDPKYTELKYWGVGATPYELYFGSNDEWGLSSDCVAGGDARLYVTTSTKIRHLKDAVIATLGFDRTGKIPEPVRVAQAPENSLVWSLAKNYSFGYMPTSLTFSDPAKNICDSVACKPNTFETEKLNAIDKKKNGFVGIDGKIEFPFFGAASTTAVAVYLGKDGMDKEGSLFFPPGAHIEREWGQLTLKYDLGYSAPVPSSEQPRFEGSADTETSFSFAIPTKIELRSRVNADSPTGTITLDAMSFGYKKFKVDYLKTGAVDLGKALVALNTGSSSSDEASFNFFDAVKQVTADYKAVGKKWNVFSIKKLGALTEFSGDDIDAIGGVATVGVDNVFSDATLGFVAKRDGSWEFHSYYKQDTEFGATGAKVNSFGANLVWDAPNKAFMGAAEAGGFELGGVKFSALGAMLGAGGDMGFLGGHVGFSVAGFGIDARLLAGGGIPMEFVAKANILDEDAIAVLKSSIASAGISGGKLNGAYMGGGFAYPFFQSDCLSTDLFTIKVGADVAYWLFNVKGTGGEKFMGGDRMLGWASAEAGCVLSVKGDVGLAGNLAGNSSSLLGRADLSVDILFWTFTAWAKGMIDNGQSFQISDYGFD